jgi:hypothetical protein
MIQVKWSGSSFTDTIRCPSGKLGVLDAVQVELEAVQKCQYDNGSAMVGGGGDMDVGALKMAMSNLPSWGGFLHFIMV